MVILLCCKRYPHYSKKLCGLQEDRRLFIGPLSLLSRGRASRAGCRKPFRNASAGGSAPGCLLRRSRVCSLHCRRGRAANMTFSEFSFGTMKISLANFITVNNIDLYAAVFSLPRRKMSRIAAEGGFLTKKGGSDGLRCRFLLS